MLKRSRQDKARQAAFADLHKEHAVGVYNLALRLTGNREDARDISQEVLLKAYEQLGHEGDLNQRAWLYRVTVNACYDHHRRMKRRPAICGDLEWDPASPVDGYEQSELSERLGSALHQLPPVQRTALILREVHGLPTEEVAQILGVQADSAAVTLSRARNSFRRHFLELTGEQGEKSKRRERQLAGAGSVGAAALVGLHVPSLSLPMVPLPAGLDIGSLVATATTAAAGTAAGLASTGSGAASGVLAKIAALATAKAATVAAGATLAAGSIGVYATVERQHTPAPSPSTQTSLAAPQTSAQTGASAPGPAAQQTPATSASSPALTVGESSAEPPASPAPTETAATVAASPSTSASAAAEAAVPVTSPTAIPSVEPTALPTVTPTVLAAETAQASASAVPSAEATADETSTALPSAEPSPVDNIMPPTPWPSPPDDLWPAPAATTTSPLPAVTPTTQSATPVYLVP